MGCDKATVDSERLVGDLVGHGAEVVRQLDEADVVLVNTCGFIDAAKRESIEAMLEAASLKREGGVKAVVAVGCLQLPTPIMAILILLTGLLFFRRRFSQTLRQRKSQG